MRSFIAAALISMAGPAFAAGDYASCLLDKLPGIQSGAVCKQPLTLHGQSL